MPPLLRFIYLMRTSYNLIKYKGFSTFLYRLICWLKGERINLAPYHRSLPYGISSPDKETLAFQRGVANSIQLAIVTPLYEPPESIWQQTIESVFNQTYTNWVWYVVDASSTDTCWRRLKEQADPRIRLIKQPQNQGISANTNIALHCVEEEWIIMLDHDDLLAPHALFTLYQTLQTNPEADVLYSDYDKISLSGQRIEPFFKPDWSPETLLCANYITHLTAYRRQLLDQVGYLDSRLDGSQDWDLYLRFSEVTDNFIHIPHILYHWRISPSSVAQSMENKPYAQSAQIKLLENYLNRQQITDFAIYHDPHHPLRKVYPIVTWKMENLSGISVIINVDFVQPLSEMILWLYKQINHLNHEIILLVHLSNLLEVKALLDKLVKQDAISNVRIRSNDYLSAQQVFAEASQYEFLLFLNSRLVFTAESNLARAWQWYTRKNIGCVGIKILDQQRHIIHSGLFIEKPDIFTSQFAGMPHNLWTDVGSDCWYRNIVAVGGGFVMLPKRLFDTINGLNVTLQPEKQLLDLCWRIHNAGYRNLYTPDIIAIDTFHKLH